MTVRLTKAYAGTMWQITQEPIATEWSKWESPHHIMYVFDNDDQAITHFTKTQSFAMDGSRHVLDQYVGHYPSVDSMLWNVVTIDQELPVLFLDAYEPTEKCGYYKFLQNGIIGYSSVGAIEIYMHQIKVSK
jgi:hypothetical protein